MQLSAHALALASAVFSASATIFVRQGLRASTAYTAFWMNVTVGVIGLWGATILLLPADAFHTGGLLLFMLSGLLGTVAGRLTRFISIEKVGAPVAAAITNLNPFISTALAILLLGERVTLPIFLGTLVIVAGTVFLSLSGQYVGFRIRALAYPLFAAISFGGVAILRKVGLSQTAPLLGAAVNMTTAWVAFTAFLIASNNRQALAARGHSLWYFIAAGVAENAGVFLLLVALSLGEVSVVVPLYGTAPLFVLLMSYAFLKGIEALNWRITLGSILIVAGVFFLTRG